MQFSYIQRLFTTSGLIAAAAISGSLASSAAPPTLRLQQQLVHAVIQNQIKDVPGLLQKGGNPNGRVKLAREDAWILEHINDDDKAPPLMVLACRFSGFANTPIVQMLVDQGGDVNIADKNHVTPLMVASQLGSSNVNLLLSKGAKVNVADRDGKSPLMYSMNNRGIDTVSTLLAKGADINARDNERVTPLMMAVEYASQDPIRLIFEDVKAKSIEAEARYIELIGFLIAQKADVNAKDKAGNTALSLALAVGQPEIAALLKKSGAK